MEKVTFTLKQQALMLVLLCFGLPLAAQTIQITDNIGLVTISAPGDLTAAINALSAPEKASLIELRVNSAATVTPLNGTDTKESIDLLTALKKLDLSGITTENCNLPQWTLQNNQTVETFIFPPNSTIVNRWFEGSALKGTLTFPSKLQFNSLGNVMNGMNGTTGITAFEGSGSQFTCEDGVLFSADKTFLYKYPTGKTDESYNIPETVTTLLQSAFNNTAYLKILTFPASLVSFRNNVEETTADRIFQSMKSLEKFEVASNNIRFASLDGILADIREKTLSSCPPKLKATQLVIDGSMVEKVSGSRFFAGLVNLKKIVFTEGFKELGYMAFRLWSSDAPLQLEYIEFPSTMEVLWGESVHECTNMTQIICKAETPPTMDGSAIFRGTNNRTKVRVGVPATAIPDYRASRWGGVDYDLGWTFEPNQIVAYKNITYNQSTSIQNVCVPNYRVEVVADKAPEGSAFVRWESQPAGVNFAAQLPSTSFLMPDNDVTITPIYAEERPYTIIGAITPSGKAALNYTVNIEADYTNANGEFFLRWEIIAGDGLVINNPNAIATYFTMIDGEVTIKAVYKALYEVNVIGGYADVLDATTGDVVTITARTKLDATFANWSSTTSGITFANANSTTTTFVMPASDVDIIANFTDNTAIQDVNKIAIVLYPNPASEFIQLSGITENVNYTIYDILGNAIKQGVTSGKPISVTDLDRGIYIFNTDKKVIKFLKK